MAELNEQTVADAVRDATRGPTETGAECDLREALAKAMVCHQNIKRIQSELGWPTDPNGHKYGRRTRLRVERGIECDKLGTLLELMTESLVYMRSGREESGGV